MPEHSQPETPILLELIGKSPFGPRSPFVEYYRPPRLGIIHLLAWTAATAVLLKFNVAMEMIETSSHFDEMPTALRVFRQVIQFVQSTVHAAGIVGVSVLLLGRVRGATGRLQPGHWIVAIDTVAFLVVHSWWALYTAARASGIIERNTFGFGSGFIWFYLPFGVISLLRAATYGATATGLRDARRWRVLFATLAVVGLIVSLIQIAASFSRGRFGLFGLTNLPLWPLIIAAVLIPTVVLDLRRGPRRDWLHWLGIAVLGVGTALSMAWWGWSLLFNRLMN